MTETILAFDPGEVTGWSTWLFDEDLPMMRADYGLIRGGVRGVVQWMTRNIFVLRPDVTISEKFRLGGDVKNPDLEPKAIEGALIAAYDALGMEEPVWHDRSVKSDVKDIVLRRANLWLTGSDPKIRWKDADDVNDSQRHALAWAMHTDHQPTLREYWPKR